MIKEKSCRAGRLALWHSEYQAQRKPFRRTSRTGQQPMAVAVNEATNKAYVVNHNSNSVTVIDGKTRTAIATIKTGAGPEGIAVNPVTNRVYIANASDRR